MAGDDERPLQSLWFKHGSDDGVVFEDEAHGDKLYLGYLPLVPKSIMLNRVAGLVNDQGWTMYDKKGLQKRVGNPNGNTCETAIVVTGTPDPGYPGGAGAGGGTAATGGVGAGAGTTTGSGQAGAGAGAGADRALSVTERLELLELSAPPRLSPRSAHAVHSAMFLIVDRTQERRTKAIKEAVAALDAKATRLYVGNGFFYKRNDFAVTAWHQLSDAERNGRPVEVFLLASKKTKHLQFVGGCEKLDVAYLRCIQCDDDQHFLEPDGMVQKDNKLAALSTRVVMFTTQLTLSKQYDEQPGLGTRTATITAVFETRFTYNASTYEGDCGCPILVRNGKVIGMHVGMVNGYSKGSTSTTSASLASSGPHDAEGVFACDFPQEPAPS